MTDYGPAGQALHDKLTMAFEFEPDGEQILAMACRQADTLAALEEVIASDGVMATGSTKQIVVHPAVAEARQARLVLARLLDQLGLGADEPAPMSPASLRGQRAAFARYRPDERRHGQEVLPLAPG